MMNYVSNVSFKLIMKGNLSTSFNPKSGLRQGDPLSPYLFILCMNVLSCMLIKVNMRKQVEGARVSRGGPRINHLMYDDDMLLFFKTNLDSYNHLAIIIKAFGDHFNLTPDVMKSEIKFSPNTPNNCKRVMDQPFGCKIVDYLGSYLGSKVVRTMR